MVTENHDMAPKVRSCQQPVSALTQMNSNTVELALFHWNTLLEQKTAMVKLGESQPWITLIARVYISAKTSNKPVYQFI